MQVDCSDGDLFPVTDISHSLLHSTANFRADQSQDNSCPND